jgi:hypothetical protein
MNTEFDWLFGRLRRETLKKQHTHRVEGVAAEEELSPSAHGTCAVTFQMAPFESQVDIHVHKNGSTKKFFKICNYCVEDFLVPSALLGSGGGAPCVRS